MAGFTALLATMFATAFAARSVVASRTVTVGVAGFTTLLATLLATMFATAFAARGVAASRTITAGVAGFATLLATAFAARSVAASGTITASLTDVATTLAAISAGFAMTLPARRAARSGAHRLFGARLGRIVARRAARVPLGRTAGIALVA